MNLTTIQHDLDMLRQYLLWIDTEQACLVTDEASEQLADACQRLHEYSFVARSLVDKLLGDLGLSDGRGHLSDLDRARAGLPANE